MMCVSFCAYLTLDPHAGIIPLESPDRGLTTDRTLTAGDVGQHVCQQFVIDRLLQYCDYLDFRVRYVVVLLITIRHLITMSYYVTMIHAETHYTSHSTHHALQISKPKSLFPLDIYEYT